MSRSHQYGPIGHGQHWNDAPPMGQIRSQSRSATPSNAGLAHASTPPPPLRGGSPSVSAKPPAAAPAAVAVVNGDSARRGSTTTRSTGTNTGSTAYDGGESGGDSTLQRDNDRLQRAIDAVASAPSRLPPATQRQLVDRVRKSLDIHALSDEAYLDLLAALLQADDDAPARTSTAAAAAGAEDDDYEHVEMEPSSTSDPATAGQSSADSGVRLRRSIPSSEHNTPASDSGLKPGAASASTLATSVAARGVKQRLRLRPAEEMRKGVVEFIRRHAADAAGVIRWASALRSLVENVLP